MRAVSSYDTTHALSGYGVYQLPLGRGMKFGRDVNRVLDAFFRGWQISATFRVTSGLPFSVGNGQRWPTSSEVSDIATPNGTPIPPVISTGNSKTGAPDWWQDPKAAFAAFQETMPGQSGNRDTLRGDGFFDIDSGVHKKFQNLGAKWGFSSVGKATI